MRDDTVGFPLRLAHAPVFLRVDPWHENPSNLVDLPENRQRLPCPARFVVRGLASLSHTYRL
jgi:hypothetical protein